MIALSAIDFYLPQKCGVKTLQISTPKHKNRWVSGEDGLPLKQKRPITFISGDSALFFLFSSIIKILPIKDALFLSVPYLFWG
jgi:hypothetical protein